MDADNKQRPAKRKKATLSGTLTDQVQNHKNKHLVRSLKAKAAEVEKLTKHINSLRSSCQESTRKYVLLSGIWAELEDSMKIVLAGYKNASELEEGPIKSDTLNEILMPLSNSCEDSISAEEALKIRSDFTKSVLEKLIGYMASKESSFDPTLSKKLSDRSDLQTKFNALLAESIANKEQSSIANEQLQELQQEYSNLVKVCERLRTEVPAESVEAMHVDSNIENSNKLESEDQDEIVTDLRKQLADSQTEIEFLKKQNAKDLAKVDELSSRLSHAEIEVSELKSQAKSEDRQSRFVGQENVFEIHANSDIQIHLQNRLSCLEKTLDWKDNLISDMEKRIEHDKHSFSVKTHSLEEKWKAASEEQARTESAYSNLKIEAEKQSRRVQDLENYVQSIHLEDPKESADRFVQEVLSVGDHVSEMVDSGYGSSQNSERCLTCAPLQAEKEEWIEMEQDLKFLVDGYQKKATPEENEIQHLRLELKKAQSQPKHVSSASANESPTLTPPISQDEQTKKLSVQIRKNNYLSSQLKAISLKFKNLQSENGKLVAQLQQQGDANAVLRFELQKSESFQDLLEKSRKMIHDQSKSKDAEESLQEQIRLLKNSNDRIDVYSRAHITKLQKMGSELSALSVELREAIPSHLSSKSMISELEDSLRSSEKKYSSLLRDHDRSKSLFERVKNENQSLLNRISRLRSGKNDIAAETELEMYRKLVTCSVCDKRRKNVAITRCKHLFCHECIQTNLDTRHRKCPACGKPFGSEDVISVYLT